MSRHPHKSSGFGNSKKVKTDYPHKDSRELDSSSGS